MKNLFIGKKVAKWLAAIDQLDEAGITDEMRERLGEKDSVYARVVREALAAKMAEEKGVYGIQMSMEPPREEDYPTIMIPDNATVRGLFANAEKAREKVDRLFLTFSTFSSDDRENAIIRRDLDLVKGRRLQVLTHAFSTEWTVEEARTFQNLRGFDGNAGALLLWCAHQEAMGYFTTIPKTDDRFVRFFDLRKTACFSLQKDSSSFLFSNVPVEHGRHEILVSFRVI